MATSPPRSRSAAWVRALGLWVRRPLALERRRRALLVLGRAAAAHPSGGDAAAPALRALWADVRRQGDRTQSLLALQARSLDADREDYARVGPLFRGGVILRGLLDRALLRHRARQHERAGRPLVVALGAHLVDAAPAEDSAWGEALAPLLSRAREVASAHRTLEDAYQQHLTVLGGELFPAWARGVGRELAGLFATVMKEVSGKLLPKASALAGMAMGWLLARSFTTSRWDGFLNELGLYRGSARVVSQADYERLQLWLPLLAAAVCSYAMARLAAVIRRRYALPQSQAAAGAGFEATATVAATETSTSTSATQMSPR